MSEKIPTLEQLLETDLEYMVRMCREEFETLSGKRLLITGGAGFLGYYFIHSVLHWNTHHAKQKIALTVYDNFMRGMPEWLTELHARKGFELRTHDMILPLPQDFGDYDYIVHAAGIASPKYYRLYPLKCIDANINGLRNLLDYSVRRRDQKQPIGGFLFFSSSEIYGDPSADAIPTPETYRGLVSCTGPRACYDESKRIGETFCVVFARQEGIPAKMARPFNNYGPGLKITDGRVIADFASDVLAGRDIVMRSDGSPTRTFCYSADAVSGYIKVLVKGHPGEAYNIGIEKPEISMRELATRVTETARSLFGYQGRLITQPSDEKDYLVDNPNRRCPIIAKAREHLGYNPTVSVEEGIRRALIWYHHNPVAAVA
jgi:nucleoside-diphosphate-sugar epimerase